MHKVCIAPMMGRTDRHERFFLRRLSKFAFLYTEMVHANAVIRNSGLLNYDKSEHPLGVQLGGSDPIILAEAAQITEEYGYDEVNLNIGCPSIKVQEGNFGAVLMKDPLRVANCIHQIVNRVQIPVSIKCRIGIDNMDEDKDLSKFIRITHEEGCSVYIIHARKAWLKGLSPKENRNVPPLNYERVYRLKEEFPELEIILNGGITNVRNSLNHLNYVDGVMIGRLAYQDPFQISEVDKIFYGKEGSKKKRAKVFKELIPYLIKEKENGTKLHQITRHLMGLFKGINNAKQIRTSLISIAGHRKLESQLNYISKQLEKRC